MNDVIIFSGKIARDLIRNKFQLVDIQPDRNCKLKTVFYFKNTNNLRQYLKKQHNISI